MKKIKVLLLFTVALIVLMLSGCVDEHTHDFKYKPDGGGHIYACDCGEVKGDRLIHAFEWKDVLIYDTAYRECNLCGYKEYQKNLNKNPVKSVSAVTGDPGDISEVYFVAEVDSGIYDYNEEFDIRLRVVIKNYYFNEGPLHVKLAESPYFEIVGEEE